MSSWFTCKTDVFRSITEASSHVRNAIKNVDSQTFEHHDGSETMISADIMQASMFYFKEVPQDE
jgi:hypothetical protein